MPVTVRLLLVWEINSPNFAAISRTSASTLIHLTVNLLRNYDPNFLAYHDSLCGRRYPTMSPFFRATQTQYSSNLDIHIVQKQQIHV